MGSAVGSQRDWLRSQRRPTRPAAARPARRSSRPVLGWRRSQGEQTGPYRDLRHPNLAATAPWRLDRRPRLWRCPTRQAALPYSAGGGAAGEDRRLNASAASRPVSFRDSWVAGPARRRAWRLRSLPPTRGGASSTGLVRAVGRCYTRANRGLSCKAEPFYDTSRRRKDDRTATA